MKAGGQKPHSDQGLEPHLSDAQVWLLTSELLGMNGLYSLLLGSPRKCVTCLGGWGGGCWFIFGLVLVWVFFLLRYWACAVQQESSPKIYITQFRTTAEQESL